MSHIRKSVLGRFLSWLALLAFCVLQIPTAALAAQSGTKITHGTIAYFVHGQRIRIDAMVIDPDGVALARVYFKAQGQAEYIFVPMTAQQTGGGSYVATLPALAKSIESLEYRFLVVNGHNAVVKTDAFVVKKKDSDNPPSWQMVKDDGPMKLFTELPDAPSVATSFSDSVSLDVIESGVRFGAATGLYGHSTSTAAAGSTAGGTSGSAVTGAAASATNLGVVSVSAVGLSTTALVAAAVAGVVGAAGASGGGGGGTSASSCTATTNPFANTSWMGTYTYNNSSGTQNPVFQWMANISATGNLTGSAAEAVIYDLSGTVDHCGGATMGIAGGGCTFSGKFATTPAKAAGGSFSCTNGDTGTWSGN